MRQFSHVRKFHVFGLYEIDCLEPNRCMVFEVLPNHIILVCNISNKIIALKRYLN